MTEYDNTNRGALFRNDKATSDKHPTHKGSINVGGVEYWLSAWVKEGKSGKFFSLSIQPKDAQPEAPVEERFQKAVDANFGGPTRNPPSAPRNAAPERSNGRGGASMMDGDEIPFSPEWR